MIQKKKKPAFKVPNLGFFKAIKARWRKPRGTANKKRMKYQFMGCLPKIGYRNADVIRGNHPSGMKEVFISNMGDLDALKGAKDVVLRFASGIGMRKRKLMEEKAKSIGLRVLNICGTPEEKTKAYEKKQAFMKAKTGSVKKAPPQMPPSQGMPKTAAPQVKSKAQIQPPRSKGGPVTATK